MGLRASYFKRVFEFNFNARTSRGLMENKVSWFIKLWDERNPKIFGIGECGPLPGLSLDATTDFEDVLEKILLDINELNSPKASPQSDLLKHHEFKELISDDFPAIRFGIETAWFDLHHGGSRIIF